MESLSIAENLPESIKHSYHNSLYNSYSYLDANNGLPQKHFYLLDQEQALGHIVFSMEEGEAMSPYKAPFGGFELADEVNSTAFLFFLNEVLRRLKRLNVRYVRIQIAAGCYESSSQMVLTDMLHTGFEEKGRRINHAIPVNEKPLTDKIAAMERRRLRKAVKEPLSFCFMKKSELTRVYDFIRHHREAKGHVLSMNLKALKLAVKANPDNYLIAGVFKGEQLIGASMLIKVSSKVIYNFFPAHDMAFNSWSPMVFLLQGVYDWCEKEEVQWLDLGTSYTGPLENKTLIAFKKHMGGEPFETVILRKTLSS